MGPPQYAASSFASGDSWTATQSGLVTLTFEVHAYVSDAVHRTPFVYTKFEVRRPSSSEDMVDFGHGVKRPSDLDLWPFDL